LNELVHKAQRRQISASLAPRYGCSAIAEIGWFQLRQNVLSLPGVLQPVTTLHARNPIVGLSFASRLVLPTLASAKRIALPRGGIARQIRQDSERMKSKCFRACWWTM
jgi:hypothetical protein